MADVAPSLTVHEVTVTLLDVSPPVWRRLRVPSPISLSVLHAVIQIAMGWEDIHLHEWRVGDLTYGPPEEKSWGESIGDESSVNLAEVGPLDSAFSYFYDLSDGWEHLVEVNAVTPYDASAPPLLCMAGDRAGPPEDSGGPEGYEHVLDALKDPADAEHDDTVAWLGDRFDPEEVDLPSVNNRLEALWRAV
ncbi:MAG: plasmid pRiA4b ORF-3 family protein [Actinomycetota bacterium]|nr:plasmid pRiA4b ORF-3 family protein [Actinomycetota bacterium]